MNELRTNFSPARHGFLFANQNAYKLPVRFCLPMGMSIDLGELTNGLPGGMCFTALDFFFTQQSVPAYTQIEELDPQLQAYLFDRQLDCLKIVTIFKFLELMAIEPQEIANRLLRSEIPKLMRALKRGKPVVLGLVRDHGENPPSHNHIVLATGIVTDPARKEIQVSLYDPNHPGIEPVITVSLVRTNHGLRMVQSTGEQLLGFFVLPYKAHHDLPVVPTLQPFISFGVEEGLPFQLRWPVDSRRVNQYFAENPQTYRPFGLPGHEGLDLYASTGAKVYAAFDGEVSRAYDPPNHPYGRQVRIKHYASGTTFHTIYAHLQSINVIDGQQISAGEWIGQADNTGNSFGSHLHFTLKIDGQQTPGYPAGIVDPWPYLSSSLNQPVYDETHPNGTLPPLSKISVFTTVAINLRAGPTISAAVTASLPSGETLNVYGKEIEITRKIGQVGQWLQVRTASGATGYVAAWLVQNSENSFPASDLVIYPINSVKLRTGPGTVFDQLAEMNADDPLTVLGSAENGRAKLGKKDEWLQIQTENGLRGFVAAWLVRTTAQFIPGSNYFAYAQTAVNIRSQPGLDTNVLTVVSPGEALECLGDPDLALAKIGMKDEWLNVRTSGKFTGYAAAWLLASEAVPAQDESIPLLLVSSTVDLNLRAQPSINSPRIGGLKAGELFEVLEPDPVNSRQKIGKQDNWVFGQKIGGPSGWAAAWFLRLEHT